MSLGNLLDLPGGVSREKFFELLSDDGLAEFPGSAHVPGGHRLGLPPSELSAAAQAQSVLLATAQPRLAA